jgi:hypothetical protein
MHKKVSRTLVGSLGASRLFSCFVRLPHIHRQATPLQQRNCTMYKRNTLLAIAAAAVLAGRTDGFMPAPLASTRGAVACNRASAVSATAPIATVARLAAKRPRRSVSALHMSAVETEAAAPAATEEKFEFQAEVSRVMDIIINSLYSNRCVHSSTSQLRLCRQYKQLAVPQAQTWQILTNITHVCTTTLGLYYCAAGMCFCES